MIDNTEEQIFKILNPHLTNIKTYSGIYLRNYQLIADKIVKDFIKGLKDTSYQNKLNEYFRILQLETGGGKTFLIQYILEKIIKAYVKFKSENGTIIIKAPRNELLEVFQKDIEQHLIEGLKKDGYNVTLYSSLTQGYSYDLHSYDTNAKGIKIIIITDQKNNISDFVNNNVDDLFFAIRDEGIGLDSDNEENAKRIDGIFKAEFIWHDKFNKLPGFKLVLNATPSASQKMRFEANDIHIYKENSKKDWIKPIIGITEVPYIDYKNRLGLEELLKDGLDCFIKDTLEINYNKDILKIFTYKNFKPCLLIKGQKDDDLDYHISVDDVLKFVHKIDDEYSSKKKEFEVENYLTGEKVKVKYPGNNILGFSLLHPNISSEKYKYDLQKLNDSSFKDNILIVCELGTYGINVPNLTHSIFLRPSERHEGRVGGVSQFLGRLKRNPFIDDYYLAQIIANSDIKNIDEYKAVKRFYLKCLMKNVFIPHTRNNSTAIDEFEDSLVSYRNKSDAIDDILLDNGYMVGWKSKIVNSKSSNRNVNYLDIRTAVCAFPGCDTNVVVTMREVFMQDYNLDPIAANELSIKSVMENAHIKDTDGKVRCLCFMHHKAETVMKKHYLPKNHPDRVA